MKLNEELKSKIRKKIIDKLVYFINRECLFDEVFNYKNGVVEIQNYLDMVKSKGLNNYKDKWYNIVYNAVYPYYIKYLDDCRIYNTLKVRSRDNYKIDPFKIEYLEFVDENEIVNLGLSQWSGFMCSVMRTQAKYFGDILLYNFMERYGYKGGYINKKNEEGF
jgi:hypothetical protein